MTKIEFSEEEKEALDYERYHHPRVRRKMEALWLKSQGLKHQEICRLASLSNSTLCRYLKEYRQGGLEKLKEINFYKPESELAQHTSQIEAYFQEHPRARSKRRWPK